VPQDAVQKILPESHNSQTVFSNNMQQKMFQYIVVSNYEKTTKKGNHKESTQLFSNPAES